MTDAPTTPSPERQPADAGGGLLPCPWCGGEGWLNDYEARWGDMPPKSRCPQCRSCGANLGYRPTPAKAIAAWNRRSPAPQAQPDARAVEAILRQHIKCDATGLAPAVASVYLTGFKEAAEAVSRLSAPAEDDGWRPIESAPKDGEYIDLWCAPLDDDGVALLPCRLPNCFWDERAWYKANSNGPNRIWHRVTHWRPLPAPPVALHPAAPTDEVGKS